MRVLIATPVVGDAFGQERVVRTLCTGLAERGHEVFLLGETRGGDLPNCVGWEVFPQLTAFHVLSPRKLAQSTNAAASEYVGKIRPDVIHFVDAFNPSWMAEMVKRYPSLHTSHTVSSTCPASHRQLSPGGGECSRPGGWGCVAASQNQGCLGFLKNDLRRFHAVHQFRRKQKVLLQMPALLAISQYVGRLLVANGADPKKVQVLYNPVPTIPLPAVRTEDLPRLVVAARLVPLKGVAVFLEALNHLKSLQWRAEVIGDGPLRAELENTAARFGLLERVAFLGKLSFAETQERLRGASILVQPNLGPEAFGMAAAEASSWGIPVVASRLAALPEVVLDGRTGLLFHPGNTTDLANQIRRLLEDEALRTELGQAAIQHVKSAFDPKQHCDRTEQIYQEIVAKFAGG